MFDLSPFLVEGKGGVGWGKIIGGFFDKGFDRINLCLFHSVSSSSTQISVILNTYLTACCPEEGSIASESLVFNILESRNVVFWRFVYISINKFPKMG